MSDAKTEAVLQRLRSREGLWLAFPDVTGAAYPSTEAWIGFSDDTARGRLAELVKQGLIWRRGKPGGYEWRAKPAPSPEAPDLRHAGHARLLNQDEDRSTPDGAYAANEPVEAEG